MYLCLARVVLEKGIGVIYIVVNYYFLDFVLICNVYCMINFVYFLAFVS